MDSPESSPVLRIGELSRRLGVSDHVLRAWESRYGLLRPVRSVGGFRLYSEADALRVGRMQAHLARGLSAAEAAREVLSEDSQARGEARRPGPEAGTGRVTPATGELSADLRRALDAFDEPAAQAVLDRPSSGSAGSRAPPALPRSTSPAMSSAGGSPGWPGAGGTGTARALSWPARRENFTIWRSWFSASP